MLTLPETLLLFALHDERGTVHSSAFLGLDDALRGSLLAELFLRGAIQVRATGAARCTSVSEPPETPLLEDALGALTQVGTVEQWLMALETTLPDLRLRLIGGLVTKGILSISEKDRVNLEDSLVFTTANAIPEAEMLEVLHQAVRSGEAMTRREGMLVGLVHCCSLWAALLDPDDRDAGSTQGEWVLERDPICQFTRTAVQKSDGTWEG